MIIYFITLNSLLTLRQDREGRLLNRSVLGSVEDFMEHERKKSPVVSDSQTNMKSLMQKRRKSTNSNGDYGDAATK